MRGLIAFIIGAALTALLGYAAHAPLGGGAAFIDRLESRAEVALGNAGGGLMEVRLVRTPALERRAVLAGDADASMRARLLAGVGTVPGIRSLHWQGESAPARGLPLLAETLLVLLASYIAGFAIGWLLWGRRRA